MFPVSPSRPLPPGGRTGAANAPIGGIVRGARFVPWWRMTLRWQTFLGLAALSLWTASLALPVVYTDRAIACANTHPTFGWSILLTGAVGPLDWQFGWYANPFILLACVQLPRHGRSFKAGLIALAIAIGSFDWHEIRIDTVDHVCSRGPGFYIWLASAVVVALADLLRLVMPRRAEAV